MRQTMPKRDFNLAGWNPPDCVARFRISRGSVADEAMTLTAAMGFENWMIAYIPPVAGGVQRSANAMSGMGTGGAGFPRCLDPGLVVSLE